MSAAFDDPRVGAAFSDVKGLSSVAGDEPPPLPPGPPPAVTWAYLNGAGMALRRHAAIEVGGFDERLGPGAPLHGEEHDLVLRLYEAGWQGREEERRVGQGCVVPCRSRWAPYHEKNKRKKQ